MAVGAQQNAFLGLRDRFFERPGYTVAAQMELLRGSIEVMELERTVVPVVAAETAGAARPLDE